MVPIPPKILSGDFLSKLNREMSVGNKIRAAAANKETVQAAWERMKKEAAEFAVSQEEMKERRRVKAAERAQERALLKRKQAVQAAGAGLPSKQLVKLIFVK